MIKVNLAGTARKKDVKAGFKLGVPASVMPLLLVLIFLGFAGGGYWWFTSLNGQVADLDKNIQQETAQKASLENVIKQDQVFEARKKTLENRIKIIEGLQRNQVSPVLALDQLSEAIDKTQYVWLSALDQNKGVLNMNGTGSSIPAIADFASNLSATGYFKNIEPTNLTQVDPTGYYTFSLRCEFSPPTRSATTGEKAGGN